MIDDLTLFCKLYATSMHVCRVLLSTQLGKTYCTALVRLPHYNVRPLMGDPANLTNAGGLVISRHF